MARSSSRVRSGLVGLLFVLACLSIVFSTIAVWAHQTLLVTDRFAAVTSRVVAEPSVQVAAADRLASEIITAVDVQGRIAGVLPGQQAFLAVPLTNAVEGVLDKKLTEFFATEKAQAAFETAIRFTHAHLITLLRNDSDFVTLEGNTATIDLLPIAVEGLRALQDEGILPATIQLPDVTDPAGRDAAIAALSDRLGSPDPGGLRAHPDRQRRSVGQGPDGRPLLRRHRRAAPPADAGPDPRHDLPVRPAAADGGAPRDRRGRRAPDRPDPRSGGCQRSRGFAGGRERRGDARDDRGPRERARLVVLDPGHPRDRHRDPRGPGRAAQVAPIRRIGGHRGEAARASGSARGRQGRRRRRSRGLGEGTPGGSGMGHRDRADVADRVDRPEPRPGDPRRDRTGRGRVDDRSAPHSRRRGRCR